jgi:hypothetical protein
LKLFVKDFIIATKTMFHEVKVNILEINGKITFVGRKTESIKKEQGREDPRW